MQNLIRNDLTLARYDQVEPRSFVPHNSLRQPLLSNFCDIVNVKVISNVQGSTSRNIFWNEKEEEGKLSFVEVVQVYAYKTEISLRANSIVTYPVQVVLL